MKDKQLLALGLNGLWLLVIVGMALMQESEMTLEQAAVLVSGLASSVMMGWLYARGETDAAAPNPEQVQAILAATQTQLLKLIGEEDEDVTKTVKSIFLLAGKAAEVSSSVLEAADVADVAEEVARKEGRKPDG